jgi:hypothetical protein
MSDVNRIATLRFVRITAEPVGLVAARIEWDDGTITWVGPGRGRELVPNLVNHEPLAREGVDDPVEAAEPPVSPRDWPTGKVTVH